MASDLHLRPLRGPSQIKSLVWSEGVHLNNFSFVRISAIRSERPLIRGVTIRVLIFAVGSRGFQLLVRYLTIPTIIAPLFSHRKAT
jgi:hypothetical protein